MNEYERFIESYKLIFDHFKNMENRYHTWMNYYSLFNGALLVAYCTILVSTGRIVEVGGTIKEQIGDAELKVLQLDCTYWVVLLLIALLGCAAAYSWYLSIVGHCRWLDNWRLALKKNNFPPDHTLYIQNEKVMYTCGGKPVLPRFYSTAEITKLFILFVLFAWLLICVYSWMNCTGYKVNILFCFLIGGSLFLLLLLVERIFGHYLFGSDMTNFRFDENGENIESHVSNSNMRIDLFVMLFLSLLLIGYMQTEMLEKKECKYGITVNNNVGCVDSKDSTSAKIHAIPFT